MRNGNRERLFYCCLAHVLLEAKQLVKSELGNGSGSQEARFVTLNKSWTAIVAKLLVPFLCIFFALQLVGCNRSELAKVNAQQLTSEEQANIALLRPTAEAIARTLDQYDSLMSKATQAQNSNNAETLRGRAKALLEQERIGARKTSYEPPEWKQIVPHSMTHLAQAYMNCKAAGIRIKAGNHVSDDELLRLFRDFQSAEREFKAMVETRPLQAAGSGSASVYLYVTLRGAPVIYEATRGEVFLGPVVPIGPFDVNPVVGPIGTSKGGTPLQRLVIRDPATKTQRAWMLNNRMPKLSVPASYIETEGTDLVITPR